ncbi:MAG TPA: redoxin domain-containing protein [Dehalococcoidia bacterium]
MAAILPPELEARPQGRREWSGWLRSLVLPLGLVVAIVAGLLYLQSGGESADESVYGSVELPAAKNATGQAPSATAGRAAPDFLLPALDGSTLRLSELQGRPVLVNFWATWCPPCRAEMPALNAAYESHADEGLIIVAVNLRESTERVSDFADEFGLAFPVVFDRAGEVARTWRIGGPTEGLPSSYFVDREGVVRKVVYGALTERTLDEGLGLILAAGD